MEGDSSRAREQAVTWDVIPVIAATMVAWWTTVRPAGYFPGSTWPPKIAATLAILGIVAAAATIVRQGKFLVAILIGGFVVPSAAAWLLGAQAATALADPIEVFVGGVAWTAVGLVLIRPQSVAAPIGAAGGRGPTIGAADDVARMAMKELDAALVKEDPPPKLVPRHPIARLAALPLYVAVGLAAIVAMQIVRVGSSVPDRAVLARIVGAAIAIALLSAAGDLVEVRYLARKEARVRTRFQRALTAIAVLILLGFIWFVWLGKDR
jgi:hypothetical protein